MVKQNKFKLIITKQDGETQEKDFKSYKEIANALNIEYHQVRELHLLSTNPKKFLHSGLKILSSKFKIISNEPEINKVKKIIEQSQAVNTADVENYLKEQGQTTLKMSDDPNINSIKNVNPDKFKNKYLYWI